MAEQSVRDIRNEFVKSCQAPYEEITRLVAPFLEQKSHKKLTIREEQLIQPALNYLERTGHPSRLMTKLIEHLDIGLPGFDDERDDLLAALPDALITLFNAVKKTTAQLQENNVTSAYNRSRRLELPSFGAAFTQNAGGDYHDGLRFFRELDKYIIFELINPTLQEKESPITTHNAMTARLQRQQHQQRHAHTLQSRAL